MIDILLILGTTTTALAAGLLYAFSVSVNIGLGRLPDRAYITAMQSINSAIQNPLFFIIFMGAFLLLPVCAWALYRIQAPAFPFFLTAAVIFWVAVFGVTMLGNIPLNQALAAFDVGNASPANIAIERIRFEKPWVRLHTIRTICSITCLVILLTGLRYNISKNSQTTNDYQPG